jgi:tetratricopeptide (TPR) repeat protein
MPQHTYGETRLAYLNILRRLVDNQQFYELKTVAISSYAETDSIACLPLLALAHAQLGELAPALVVYKQALERLNELDPDARVDLAGVDCVLQRIDAAVELLEPVLQQQPEHPLALARLGWCRLQQNRWDEAQQLYRRSTEQDKRRLPVWMALTRLYLHGQQSDSAQQALHRAIECFEQRQSELPPAVVELFTAQLRGLQLEIWVASEQFAQAEEWLAQRREDLHEEVWTALVAGYITLLAGCDRHPQAEEALRAGLQHYPDNKGLLLQLAELAQVQGHTMQAVRALRRALRFDKENPALWSRLSTACLHRFDQQARNAAEKALALATALQLSEEYPAARIQALHAQAQNALAQVESQEQNFDVAEKLFCEVLEQSPFFVPALQGLAQQQMQRGKIDEALALYEQVKQVDPLKAYSALINARHYPEDIATLERMEKAAQTPSLEGQVRAGILFQLAAAWEKRKDYPKAFELAHQANAASKKFLTYDAHAHRNQCFRVRSRFGTQLYQHRHDCGVNSTLPVYVLGMPRSGTTLVEQIIAGHSQIFGAGELGVIPQRIAGLNRWERHVGSGRHYPDCIDDLSPYVSTGIAQGILNELKELAEHDKPQATHVVDKLPHNFENIGLIKLLFPNAKIISVRRDPRDIAISNYFTDYQAKHGGMGFAYDLTTIGEQLADHNMLMHHWQQLFPGEILEINYEDVVDDLEGSARKLLDYIGVDWEPQVLKFNELERPVKTASVWQVRQPIYKTSKAKWEHYQEYLQPLIKGTNAPILPDPIEDMLTLPVPGFLQTGVEHYRKGELREAELSFKKMLHHNPEHAAANYMVGLVYCSVGHVADAIPLLEKALEKCPWQKEWRENLVRAYRESGRDDDAEALEKRHGQQTHKATDDQEEPWVDLLDETVNASVAANP